MKQVAEPRPSWSASAVKYLQNLQNRHSSTGVPVLFFEMFITRNAGAGADPKVWLRLQQNCNIMYSWTFSSLTFPYPSLKLSPSP